MRGFILIMSGLEKWKNKLKRVAGAGAIRTNNPTRNYQRGEVSPVVSPLKVEDSSTGLWDPPSFLQRRISGNHELLFPLELNGKDYLRRLLWFVSRGIRDRVALICRCDDVGVSHVGLYHLLALIMKYHAKFETDLCCEQRQLLQSTEVSLQSTFKKNVFKSSLLFLLFFCYF